MTPQTLPEKVPSSRRSRIAVIGAGYVGMPTALVLSSMGHHVTVAERDAGRRNLYVQGRSPIMEEDLEEVLQTALQSGELSFVESAAEAVSGAKYVFLCVATPSGPDGRANMTDVESAIGQIRQHLDDGAIIVNKSTVPVGSAVRVASLIGRESIKVVANPEFLREGKAIADSFRPHRIVVGSSDRDAAQSVAELFAPTGAPTVITNEVTAELIKYVANSFLALKLSYVNAIAEICDATGANVDDIVKAVGLDPRIGATHFTPGPGWGGPCLPKDVAELMGLAREVGVDATVIDAAHVGNERHEQYVVSKIQELSRDGDEQGSVAVLGLTFKASTGDRYGSPSLRVARELVAAGVSVRGYDPTVGVESTAADLQGIDIKASVADAARGASVVAVLTEWPEFADLDWTGIGELMLHRRVFDARGVVDASTARRAAFVVHQLGRVTDGTRLSALR